MMIRSFNGDNDDHAAARANGDYAEDGDADDKQGWADVSRGRSSVVAAAAS